MYIYIYIYKKYILYLYKYVLCTTSLKKAFEQNEI